MTAGDRRGAYASTFPGAPSIDAARSVSGLPPTDLVVTVLGAAAGAIFVWLHGPLVARLLFGLPLVLFLPGWAVVSALFPARTGPDLIERVAFSFGLSLATMPLVSLALERLPWQVRLTPTIVALLLVVVGGSAIAGIRRRVLPAADRFAIDVRLPVVAPIRDWRMSTRLLAVLGSAGVILVAAGGTPMVLVHLNGHQITEFALYNPAGDAARYPRQLVSGQTAEFRVEVANYTDTPVRYIIEVDDGAALPQPVRLEPLEPGEQWNGPISVVPGAPGAGRVVRFDLYRDGIDAPGVPHRTLELVVDVTSGEQDEQGAR